MGAGQDLRFLVQAIYENEIKALLLLSAEGLKRRIWSHAMRQECAVRGVHPKKKNSSSMGAKK